MLVTQGPRVRRVRLSSVGSAGKRDLSLSRTGVAARVPGAGEGALQGRRWAAFVEDVGWGFGDNRSCTPGSSRLGDFANAAWGPPAPSGTGKASRTPVPPSTRTLRGLTAFISRLIFPQNET